MEKVQLRYHNFLITPSGKKVDLYEITNENYSVLIKFCNARDYEGFFNALDQLISESIPDFNEFNFIDKIYIYIAYCFYSIHDSIIYKSNFLIEIDISLNKILDNIEAAYTSIKSKYNLTDNIIADISIPRNFSFVDNQPVIDYISALDSINGYVFKNNEERKQFVENIAVKYSAKLEQVIRKNCIIECGLFNSEGDKINLIAPELLQIVFRIYSEPLEEYYKILYYNFEYLKMSIDTFNKLTPRENRIIFRQFIEDKERQAEEQRNQIVHR